jgi:hypothetical protein
VPPSPRFSEACRSRVRSDSCGRRTCRRPTGCRTAPCAVRR